MDKHVIDTIKPSTPWYSLYSAIETGVSWEGSLVWLDLPWASVTFVLKRQCIREMECEKR